ncbi:hypothetical protein AB0L41_12640 [Amycolatopsis mediterranei]|uniref:hypothetical protein n=1 Tax=Amycolatopsis mediterranei TaxID=33910 RepID=UPI00341AC897
MVSYPQYNLSLPGWDYQSVWGWDPARETFYAQLVREGRDPIDDGLDHWISPPTYPAIPRPADLAEIVAQVIDLDTATVRAAMNASLPSQAEQPDHPLRQP